MTIIMALYIPVVVQPYEIVGLGRPLIRVPNAGYQGHPPPIVARGEEVDDHLRRGHHDPSIIREGRNHPINKSPK